MSDADVTILQPAGWPRPQGYANGIAASGRLVFVAGQIGWDVDGVLRDGLVEQVRQALANCLTVLAEAGAEPGDIVRMTWYVADRADYAARRAEIGAVYRELLGRSFPTMSLLEVGLVEPGALVEIEVTAVV